MESAVIVHMHGIARSWALPIFVALYRSPETNLAKGRPHCTPAQLMQRLPRLALLNFPRRKFVFVGDFGYCTHETVRFCRRQADRLTLAGKLRPDANLFLPPPAYAGRGRPRVKGGRLPKPREAVERIAPKSRSWINVPWHGSDCRYASFVTNVGHWFKCGHGLVPLRWVFVADLDGTHRDEYFFTTDSALLPVGGGVVVRLAARGATDRGDPSGGEGRSDLHGCVDGGSAPDLGGSFFPTVPGAEALSKLPPHVRELLLSALTLAA